jgi:hypothetical protein
MEFEHIEFYSMDKNPKSSLSFLLRDLCNPERLYPAGNCQLSETYGLTTLTVPYPCLGIGLNFTLWTNPKSFPCSFLYRDFCNLETLYPAGNCQLSKMYGLTTLTVPHPSLGIGLMKGSGL